MSCSPRGPVGHPAITALSPRVPGQLPARRFPPPWFRGLSPSPPAHRRSLSRGFTGKASGSPGARPRTGPFSCRFAPLRALCRLGPTSGGPPSIPLPFRGRACPRADLSLLPTEGHASRFRIHGQQCRRDLRAGTKRSGRSDRAGRARVVQAPPKRGRRGPGQGRESRQWSGRNVSPRASAGDFEDTLSRREIPVRAFPFRCIFHEICYAPPPRNFVSRSVSAAWRRGWKQGRRDTDVSPRRMATRARTVRNRTGRAGGPA